MDTVSSIVKRIVDTKPFIHESMIHGIVSFGNLAEIMLPEIELQYGKHVKTSAVVMALRRYGEELKERAVTSNTANVSYEIIMKTNIFDINIMKTKEIMGRVASLYSLVSLERGDFLNITWGSNQISIAISEKYEQDVLQTLDGVEILHCMSDLVALSVIFSGDFLNTPGIIYEAVRKLAWENINVIEIVSTMNELTFVIERIASIHAFEALQSFLQVN